jgi:hypothetical protein
VSAYISKEHHAGRCSSASSFSHSVCDQSRYLKTTIAGLTGMYCDYACLIIGGNMGISKMTKEHLGVALALSIPIIVVITKIDMTPPDVLKENVKQLFRILKSPAANKIPVIVRSEADLAACFVPAAAAAATIPAAAVAAAAPIPAPTAPQPAPIPPAAAAAAAAGAVDDTAAGASSTAGEAAPADGAPASAPASASSSSAHDACAAVPAVAAPAALAVGAANPRVAPIFLVSSVKVCVRMCAHAPCIFCFIKSQVVFPL